MDPSNRLRSFSFARLFLLSLSLCSWTGSLVLDAVDASPTVTKFRKTANSSCDNSIKAEAYVKSLVATDYNREVFAGEGFEEDSTPIVVFLEMSIQQLADLSAASGDLEIELFFTEIWQDKRLQFASLDTCRKNVTFDREFEKQIWLPRVCATNSKLAKSHSSPAPNEFLIIYADGTVWRNHRMKLRAPCHFQIDRYPFDQVYCSLKFGSFSYQTNEVRLEWLPNKSVTLMGPFLIPDYELMDYDLRSDFYGYRNGADGNWQRLEIVFRLRRRFGYHFLQTYLPTAATVSISWVTFCLEERSSSARVSVGVSALLALSFQLGSHADHLPHASQLKAMDIWMLSCICFVCATLLQTVLVARIGRWQRRENLKHITVNTLTDILRARRTSSSPAIVPPSASELRRPFQPITRRPSSCADKRRRRLSQILSPNSPRYWWLSKITTNRIDKGSLYLVPAAFGVFNMIYWAYYGGLYFRIF